MPLQEFILELAKWTAVFSLLTFIVHLLQTRMIKEWRAESKEWKAETNKILKSIADAQAESRKEAAEAHKAHEETMRGIKETQRHIADLIVREGEKTRETI